MSSPSLRPLNTSKNIYYIGIRFRRKDGTWSQPYTYTSSVAYDKYTYVVVPVDDWYSVAVVDTCTTERPANEKFEYKAIFQRIERPE